MEAMSGKMLVSSMAGLDMPIHPPPQQQHFPPHPQPHHQTVSHTQSQQSVKHNTYSYPTKAKQQQLSDEDEAGYSVEEVGVEGKKKFSPWQRMKWTDSMVRLLVMVVFYIGDDYFTVEANNNDSNGNGAVKKKAGGGGVLQKKGKWKSVSRAMMEKGFYVSPQQCEDKFNDLNKRYKRVNDILGKGTACRVVENQSLLDRMDHLSPKMKEEVRKLLNSKHLFFREMCAYHNSCGGGGQSSEVVVEVESSNHPRQQQQQQQHCFHSSENGTVVADSKNRMGLEGFKNGKRGRDVVDLDGDDDDEDDDGDDNDNDNDNDDDNEDGEETEGAGRSHENNGDVSEMVSSKKQRREMFTTPLMKQMSCELVSVLQDGSKPPWEQRQWMMSRTIQLEEQKVSCQCQAFELEKQRLKWMKFSAKKEREMERMKLNNERMRLENERMVLLLRKKELQIFHHHHQQQQQQSSNKRPDYSSSMAG